MARVNRQNEAMLASLTRAMNPGRMNFDYVPSGSLLSAFRTTANFDGGHHTYTQLPARPAILDASAFLPRTQTGDKAILNQGRNGPRIIADGLFERGELVAGVGRSQNDGEDLEPQLRLYCGSALMECGLMTTDPNEAAFELGRLLLKRKLSSATFWGDLLGR